MSKKAVEKKDHKHSPTSKTTRSHEKTHADSAKTHHTAPKHKPNPKTHPSSKPQNSHAQTNPQNPPSKQTPKSPPKTPPQPKGPNKKENRTLEEYEFKSNNIPVQIKIVSIVDEFVPLYKITIATLTPTTEYVLEKIRQEIIKKVNLGMIEITDQKKTGIIEDRFKETILNLVVKYFPNTDTDSIRFLTSYLVQKSLGMGKVEILMDDPNLEEIAINSADEPVWVYHRKHGWVKSDIFIKNEEETRHYSTMIGRKVGRQITILNPLMDANMDTGDRVNATLMPISNRGNTITLRKFASKPWTITDLIKSRTISVTSASLIWLAIQYELSVLIAGGTASGKTSMLNSMSNLFPPNQRILSIEDTREVRLPKFLHWIPMVTRLPNPEGKGEVSMLDLLVNSLRQRPDRIIVGEIRRKKEAEVLFEAIHTGHSVYATVHANSAKETVTRLTSPPIEVPKTMLPAISLIVVQYRNRRTGMRRTFQIAEITEDGKENVLMQYDNKTDTQKPMAKSIALLKTIELYTGMSSKEINAELAEKQLVLKWLVLQGINNVDSVGRVMAEYYTNKDYLMYFVKRNIPMR